MIIQKIDHFGNPNSPEWAAQPGATTYVQIEGDGTLVVTAYPFRISVTREEARLIVEAVGKIQTFGGNVVVDEEAIARVDLRQDILDLIEGVMADAKVDFPAGVEAGPRVSWDEEGLADAILALLPAPASERIAELERALADETEACAKVAESLPDQRGNSPEHLVGMRIAAAIRARTALASAQFSTTGARDE